MGGWTAGASVSRADYTQPFTLRWWKKVLVLCFSQITFRLMSISSSELVLRLVGLRQTIAH
jgi:hypothetical protein